MTIRDAFTCQICRGRYGATVPIDDGPSICGPCYNRTLTTLTNVIRHAEAIINDTQALLGPRETTPV
jgi:hypothetical protein